MAFLSISASARGSNGCAGTTVGDVYKLNQLVYMNLLYIRGDFFQVVLTLITSTQLKVESGNMGEMLRKLRLF